MTDSEFGTFDQHVPSPEEVAAARAAHEREVAEHAATQSTTGPSTIAEAESTPDQAHVAFANAVHATSQELNTGYAVPRELIAGAQTGLDRFQGRAMELGRSWVAGAQRSLETLETEVKRTNSGKVLSSEQGSQALADLKATVQPQAIPAVLKGDTVVLPNMQQAANKLAETKPTTQMSEAAAKFQEPIAQANDIQVELTRIYAENGNTFVLTGPEEHERAFSYLQQQIAELSNSLQTMQSINKPASATGTHEQIRQQQASIAEQLQSQKAAVSTNIQALRQSLAYLEGQTSPQAEQYLVDLQMHLYRLGGQIAAQQDNVKRITAGL